MSYGMPRRNYGPRPGGFQMSRHISIRNNYCPPRLCPPSFPPQININNFGGGCSPRQCPPPPMPMPYPVAQPMPYPVPMPVMQQPTIIQQPIIMNQPVNTNVAANQGSFNNEFNPSLFLPPLPPPPAAPAKKNNLLKKLLIGLAVFLGIKHLNKQKETIDVKEKILKPKEPVVVDDDLPTVDGNGTATGA